MSTHYLLVFSIDKYPDIIISLNLTMTRYCINKKSS